ncbi:MAG: phosphotransferase enzyme family protein [Elusimicrobia bacterium RIFOXYA2_FULL_58_8]|nr:MAG: phosphotransferase enzyme family protein [Elusimicrobia bacterium RIFOXYA2_FULL_58_8]OGS12831.1 MAG: phosphotransferase enzyme family protein [Elusimicrobia bacterium RIFOXYA12_FULL_57_11]
MPLKNTEQEKAAQSDTALRGLYLKTFGAAARTCEPLKGDASARRLFRMGDGSRSVIGAVGPDKLENRAFLEFSRHFRAEKLPVPEIYAADQQQGVYLEEDLGSTTLFEYLTAERKSADLPGQVLAAYKKVLEWLPRFQAQAGRGLDLSVCYPRASFDRQSIMWDLNYFKYYFLKLAKIPFNEQKLEDDFVRFTDFLLDAPSDFFLYRDFQSRNIMLRGGEPWFIDYQGGRRGAAQYDLASLLYDAKADLPPETRSELHKHYLAASGQKPAEFMRYYHAFAYIRIMQAMGAYGLRGFYEGKTHFLNSVPYAVRNIEWLLRNAEIEVKLPELTQCFKRIAASSYLRQFGKTKLGLTVRINSFSFKNGQLLDDKGHGGGFVFDCRALPNPGRCEQYAQLTGKDKPVIEFLQKEPGVARFLENVFAITDMSVENYLSRNFTSLMVNFGCTGGRHRSVYCAEALAARVKQKYGARVELGHREMAGFVK